MNSVGSAAATKASALNARMRRAQRSASGASSSGRVSFAAGSDGRSARSDAARYAASDSAVRTKPSGDCRALSNVGSASGASVRNGTPNNSSDGERRNAPTASAAGASGPSAHGQAAPAKLAGTTKPINHRLTPSAAYALPRRSVIAPAKLPRTAKLAN